MKFLKKYYTSICSFMIVFVFFLFFMVFNKITPFGQNTIINHDCLQQVYPFLNVLYDKLKNGDSLFYFGESGLGMNFLATYFYYLSSPINLLVIFFDKSDIVSFISFSIIIRLSLSAGTFGFYLSHRYETRNNIIIIPLSCAYSLSNFLLAYYHESMWLDTFVIFPIIMYGYERLIKEKKPVIYILCLAIAAYLNFYMVYIIGLFLCFWFLVDAHENIKGFFSDLLRFILSSLLSIGMSLLPIMVSYLGVRSTHVSEEGFWVKHEWFGNIFEVLRSVHMFSTLQTIGHSLHYSNIYSGTFCIVFIFIYFFVLDIPLSERIRKLCLVIFLILSMDESILNYVWHAFHTPIYIPNRFGFAYIFLILTLSYDVINHINKDKIKWLLPGVILAEVFPMICYFFVDFDSSISSVRILTISLILILIYNVLIICVAMDKKILRTVASTLMCIVMISELIINAGFLFKKEIKSDNYFNYIKTYKDVFVEVENRDDSYYRSHFIENEIYNINSICGTNGVPTFSSLIPFMTYVFQSYSGVVSGDNAISSYELTELMESIYGEKYIYIPKDKDIYKNKCNYKNIYENNEVVVYENEDALSLGFGGSEKISGFNYIYDEPFAFQNQLVELLTGGEQVFEEYVPKYNVIMNGVNHEITDNRYPELLNTFDSADSRQVEISFDVDKAGEYYICLNINADNFVTIYKNDEYLRMFNEAPAGDIFYVGDCQESDRISIILYVTYDDVFEFQGSENVGFRVARFNEDVYKEFIKKASSNQMKIDRINSSYFKGNVTLDNEQILFTTIPYDNGWKVFENGKKVDVIKIADAYVGVNLGAGEHNVEFKYLPPGFNMGLIGGLVSWLIFSIFAIFSFRGKTAEKENVNIRSTNEDNKE